MAKEYDIKGNPFNFNADLAYGEKGEGKIRSFLEDIISEDIEVKTDRYRNGRMVVETQQNPKKLIDNDGNPVWVQSGINVTTAKWWVYIFTLDGSFVVVATDRLKRFLTINNHKYNESTKRTFAAASDNPSRGFLIMQEDMLDLLLNPIYDSGENDD